MSTSGGEVWAEWWRGRGALDWDAFIGQRRNHAQEYVTVEIQEGTLRGQMPKTWTDIPMFMFQGIPYAEPPVGDLRFQPPVSKAAWSGVRDALAVGSMCPQLDNNAASGDEDCLYLNVFGPETALQKEELKPVMVWIHGGCFTSGFGQGATPNYYVDQDVILVSINYRLGLLAGGSLSTEAKIENLNENFGEIVGCDLRLPTKEERVEGAESIKKFYYNGSDITLKDNYTTALFDSHLFFVEGLEAAIRSMSQLTSQPVYYYQFSFVGPLSAYPGGPERVLNEILDEDSDSGSESEYEDGVLEYDSDRESDVDVKEDEDSAASGSDHQDVIVAKSGRSNPTPEQTSLLTETWKEYDESTPYYLEITRPLRLKTSLFEPYMNFWLNLLPS
ncbi:carboxylesterase 5A-like [Schistocerca piceifrons]|uniref:carboxylesterase 5A-like n=1 Tax=Schistocerca piceifrons TaxID=274613 RepID=UPI001F5F7328|nr:carboxylesterase 5A-like [Schistocerca piceifrons]